MNAADQSHVSNFINITIPVWIYDINSLQILSANEAAMRTYGYTHQEFVALTVNDIIFQENPNDPDIEQKLSHCLQSNGPLISIWEHKNKQGTPFTVRIMSVRISFGPIKAKLVVVDEVSSIMDDVLGNQSELRGLVNSDKGVAHLLESVTDGFFAVDREFRLTYVNQHFCETFGQKREEILGKDVCTIVPKDFGKFIYNKCKPAIDKGEKLRFTNYYPAKNSWFCLQVYPYSEGASILFKDITNEMVLQNTIERERSNLTALINNTDDLIWSVDKHFNLMSANEMYLRLTQIGSKRLQVGDSIFSNLFDQHVINKWKKRYERVLEGETYTIEELTEEYNYQTLFYETNFIPIRNEEQEIIGVGCFSRDVTETKKKELLLENYRQLCNTRIIKEAEGENKIVSSILSQFNFKEPNSADNKNLIYQLRSTTAQLEELIKKSSGTPG